MPRRRRIILPGFPHHVTHRANRKGPLYKEEEDYRYYLENLKKYSEFYELPVYSYCLMTNHIHLVVLPESKESLSRCMHDLDGVHASYFNSKYEVSGHLWQERYFACALDNEHLWNALRYVEQNPVRAGLVRAAEEYPWSSAAAHCGLKSDGILADDFPPRELISIWGNWLAESLPDEDLKPLRRSTLSGIPCGSDAFLTGLESMLGLSLRPRKTGPNKSS